jgi:hypothetical protein
LDPVTHLGLVDTFTTEVGYGIVYYTSHYLANNPYADDSADQGYVDGHGILTKVDSDTTDITYQVMVSASILDFDFTAEGTPPFGSTFTVYSYYADGTEASRYDVKILPPLL